MVKFQPSSPKLLHWPPRIPLDWPTPFSPPPAAACVRSISERESEKGAAWAYGERAFVPFWWERLGLLFKGLRQMVGASCEAMEEEK